MSSKQPTKMASSQDPAPTPALLTPSKYSNLMILKTILEREDRGLGLVGERVVIGGWVKSSKEVVKEPVQPPPPPPPPVDVGRHKDVSCVEILQSRLPFFRCIMKVLTVAGGGADAGHPVREKLEPAGPPRPPPPSIAYLSVSDGSCVASLQVQVESSIAPTKQLLATGTCIVAEGVLKEPSMPGKHVIELQGEKILHIGTVDQDRYPLSKKRLPLEMLRECPHFRHRTTTLASVMRIRSALSFATHTFFQNHGFLHVQVPIITTIVPEGLPERFQVTTLFEKTGKKEPTEVDGVSLEVVKGAIKEKTSLVEELKRSDSNKEALVAALQDLRKANELASQLEAREKLKSVTTIKADKFNFSEDFFSCKTYLATSCRLHLESYACALGNVYAFVPRFQANKTLSAKQAAEMWVVETEMVFSQLEDAMNCVDDYFKFLCKWILENCIEDMKFFLKRIDMSSIDRLSSITSMSFQKIPYMDAVEALKNVTDTTFERKLQWGVALTEEHLRYLADETYKSPIIIYNYPKAVKPFYVRLNDDGKTVAAFDMVVPKVGTLFTGSQNEERIDILTARIKELDMQKEQYEWYMDLRRNGTAKHSGFSLAFDLMVLFATGLTDVRDVIPFPRTSGKASC